MIDPNSFAADVEARLRELQSRKPGAAAQLRASGTPALASPAIEFEEPLRAFEEVAAVTGRFAPDDLFRPGDSEDVRQLVLTRARRSFSVESSSDKVLWFMAPAVRRKVLKRLIESRSLEALLDTASLPETDEYGELLRQVLRRGAAFSWTKFPQSKLLALKSVMEDLQDVCPGPKPEAISRKLQASGSLEEYSVLVKDFVGRKNELRALEAFLSGPASSEIHRQWSAVLLTGIGGAGKSALLAKFILDVVSKKSASVVVLDFDRPGMDPKDTIWLRAEIARQLGRQYPQLREQLDTLRRENRWLQTGAAMEATSQEKVSQDRSSDDILYGVQSALESIGQGRHPLLIVLDTLEEVVNSDTQYSLIEWLDSVGRIFATFPLKVVFSGRLFDTEGTALRTHSREEPIQIDELPEKEAQKLLVKLGVSPTLAAPLTRARLLPLRPLELRLIARLLQGEGASLKDLETKLRGEAAALSPPGAARELAAGIVYRRVLLRIDDETARHIACPGLVLRYVSREILQGVLVPALDLPPMEDDEADAALEKLAQHNWLVTKQPNGALWHRRDLRRSMLKLMRVQEPELTRRISQTAVKFFEELSPATHAEAVYHRLLLMQTPEDGATLELPELAEVNASIGGDIADLPPAGAALLRFATQKSISAADVALLPSVYFARAYRKTGQGLLRAREFGMAYRLIERKRGERGTPVESFPPEDWESETLLATGRWDEVPLTPVSGVSAGNPWRAMEEVSRALYRFALVEQETGPPLEYEQRFTKAAEQLLPLSGWDFNIGPTFQRLAVALVLLYARGERGTPSLRAAGRLLERLSTTERKPRSALLQHRLFLLSLMTDTPWLDSVTLAPSTVILRPKTIRNVAASGDMEHLSDLLRMVLERLTPTKDRPMTAKGLLSAIDALYKHKERWASAALPLKLASQPTLDMLRGPDAEFRDPTRFALLAEFTDRPARKRLAGIVAGLVDIPLADLDAKVFADTLEFDAEHALEPYIEVVDRSWRLGELLDAVCAERPESQQLCRIRDAHHRWDISVQFLLTSHFNVAEEAP